MAKSTIEWTEASWNPVTGCTKISEGCLNCYAERLAYRLKAMGQKNYKNGFELTLHADSLKLPSQWRIPQMIFVCSMSDLFHDRVPFDFLSRVYAAMNEARQHTFQVLTKRSRNLVELGADLNWTNNIWAGVTVESSAYLYRIDDLRSSQAKVRFLSLEPLLGPITGLDLTGIDWVIVGGESGPGARPMDPNWVMDIRDKCLSDGVPFFFKQWGGMNKKKAGRTLEGRTWDERPSAIRPGWAAC